MNHLFEITDTRTNESEPVFCLMDTKEGSEYFGHWINECAVFLPYINDMKKQYPMLKIVLYDKRMYKVKVLFDFGFQESDIIYTLCLNECNIPNYYCCGRICNTSYVAPPEGPALVIKPSFFFVPKTGIRNTCFLECVKRFQEHYRNSIGSVEKSIPIIYLIRANKENSKGVNFVEFTNLDEMVSLCNKYSIRIVNIDDLTTIREQVELVMKSKIIIHEFGSAFINSTYFSKDSHSIILNSYGLGEIHMNLMYHMMQINGVTWEIFPSISGKSKVLTIDIPLVEKRILQVIK